MAGIEDEGAALNGIVIAGDNFQALTTIGAAWENRIQCTYIDPPYNTGSDGFPYKDSFQRSSWLAMMNLKLMLGHRLMARTGTFFGSIGEQECHSFKQLLLRYTPDEKAISTIVWKARVKPVNIGTSKYRPQREIEYVLSYEKQFGAYEFKPLLTGTVRTYHHTFKERKYRIATILKSNRGTNYRSTMSFEIDGYTPPEGQRWQAGDDEVRWLKDNDYVEFRDGTPFRRYFEDEEGEEHDPFYCHMEGEWSGTSEIGKSELNHILGNQHGFDTVKPTRLIKTLVTPTTAKGDVVLDYFAGSGTTAHALISLEREGADRRRYILVEAAEYFDTLLIPRLKKVIYANDWKEGKPQSRNTGVSHACKVLRLESYEDTLNNLRLPARLPEAQELALQAASPAVRDEYTLGYMLELETQGSPSLLNVSAFTDPFSYTLQTATGTAGETRPVNVDLVETFNWLLGLTVRHTDFIREVCVVDGTNPQGERVLVLWRNTAKVDAEALNEWFTKQGYSTRDLEYEVIYVNGDHHLENLRRDDQTWKVRMIDEEFPRLMWEGCA